MFDVISYTLAKRALKKYQPDNQYICLVGNNLTICDESIDYTKIADIETVAIVKHIILDANTLPVFALHNVLRRHKNVVLEYDYRWDSAGQYGVRLGNNARMNDTYDTGYDFSHATGETTGPHKIRKISNGTYTDLATGLGQNETTGVWYHNDAVQVKDTTLTWQDNGVIIASVSDTDIAEGNNIRFVTWDSGNIVHVKNIIVKRAASIEAPEEKQVYLVVPKIKIKEPDEEHEVYTNPLTVLANLLLGRPVPVVVVADLGNRFVVAVHEGVAGDLVKYFTRLNEEQVIELLRNKIKIKSRKELYKRFYAWNEHVDRKPIAEDEAKTIKKELDDITAQKVKKIKENIISIIK